MQLKENQANLFDSVSVVTARYAPASVAASHDKGRSRQEDRTVEVFAVGDSLVHTEWAPFIKTILRVTRATWLRCAATGMWHQRGEVAFYV